MGNTFNWSLLKRKHAGVDRADVSANGLEDLVSHVSRIEGERDEELEKLAAMESQELDTNYCALKSITDEQVRKVAKAFWRRIYAYRNDYGIELPDPMPVEFMAHMATALTWVDKPVPADKPSVAVPDALQKLRLEVAEVINILAMCGDQTPVDQLGKKLAAALNASAPSRSQKSAQAGYAGVTVWVGDKTCTQYVSKLEVDTSRADELLRRFENARFLISQSDRCPSHERGGE